MNVIDRPARTCEYRILLNFVYFTQYYLGGIARQIARGYAVPVLNLVHATRARFKSKRAESQIRLYQFPGTESKNSIILCSTRASGPRVMVFSMPPSPSHTRGIFYPFDVAMARRQRKDDTN